MITLAADGSDRSMFGGAFVVDNYALVFMGFFLVVAYFSLLVSVDYIGEGDYYQGEYYLLLLTSVLGLIAMASRTRPHLDLRRARDDHRSRRSSSRGGASTTTKSNEAAHQVLPDRCAVDRGDAVRHVVRVRR